MSDPPQAFDSVRDADLLPHLRFDARISARIDATVVEFGASEVEIRGIPFQQCRHALAEMYGDRTISQIASVSGLPLKCVAMLCRSLVAHGAAEFVPPRQCDRVLESSSILVSACAERFPEWKQRLFSHPLWVSLADGTAPRSIFIGWLIESYHFIEGVTVRLPMAIAGSNDHAVRRIFAKHFAEEYDHHHFFLSALKAAGIDAQWLGIARPLPGTSAILNHMRSCARRDPLAYAACSGFLESTGADHERARIFFDRLAVNFDSQEAAIVRPIAAHAALDEGYQHSGFLGRVADAIGPLTRSRAEAALQSTHLLVETLEVWSTDILRHYGHNDGLSQGVRRYRPLDKADMSALDSSEKRQ